MNDLRFLSIMSNSVTNKPAVYLAGKIYRNDWRHKLVEGLRDHSWNDGPIETKKFIYMGPFFVSCDHACAHYPNSHGAVGQDCVEPFLTREEVIQRNKHALKNSDLIFCYINSGDCNGSLIELGMAIERSTPIVLAFAPWINHDDYWYGSLQSMEVEKGISEDLLSTIFEKYLTTTVKAKI